MMVALLHRFAILAGSFCVVAVGVASETKEPAKPKVEVHWVEPFRVEGLTVGRSVASGDTKNEYYPHVKPAMILNREDVAETRLQQFDWVMNGEVVHHYSVTVVLTKDARERLAKNCPRKSARITVAVDGKFWGWDHYSADNDADVAEQSKARNYSPCLGLMSRENAESIIKALK